MEHNLIDASNDFAHLSNDIGKFKEELCSNLSIEFTSQDFRLVFLDTIQQYLLSLTSYIRAFMELQKRLSTPDEFLEVLNIGINTVEEYEASRLAYKFPIESLVTMIHFQIDSFLGSICTRAGESRTGFYKRMKAVLDSISMEEAEKVEWQNVLQCLAFFRNSFHNAGYHTINRVNWENGIEPDNGVLDRSFSKAGFTIAFKHNELIEYNWKSIFLLIQESVDVAKKLIKTLYINN